ncbi:MAG TPA: TIGR02147 family protein [Bdellovibrionales bacterium]|nr:TIGR02147 family protein [Bdellovibrionales bacterium]
MLLKTNSPRKFLTEELARRQKINPRYSMRAFARHIGLSPGELSELLRGKRKLSLKSAVRVAKSLSLSQTESKHLLYLAQLEQGDGLELIPAAGAPKAKEELTAEIFHLVSDWACFAILNLSETAGFAWKTPQIAKRLGITVNHAQAALDRLERVGLVKDVNGKKKVDPDYVLAAPGIPSEAIRAYHKTMLQKAADALDFQKMNERDITGIGIALDPKHIDSIRKDIAEFQEQLAEKYRNGKKTEVYQLEVALFRLTEGERHEN